jgi:D-3-phosphoglycerate dehydrogenase
MTELQPRIDLWRTPATKVAVAGGRNSRLAEATERELRSAPQLELIQRPLLEPDGSVAREVAESDVLITGGAKLDDAIFSQLTRVRFVLRPYVGYDDIDVDAATRHGILFANVPDTFIEEVANQTMAFILATNRKVREADLYVREGKWSNGGRARDAAKPIQRVSALTLGFVGFGNIARLVLERAKPFGFKFLAADPYVSAEAAAAAGVELVSLEDLMRRSDVVSVHVFLNAETRGLINAQRLALMKPTAYLVNTSRGPVIDEAALIETLRARRIAGAALDVFEVEPVAADNPLLQMDNVLLSGHIASYSEEGDARHQIRIAEIALQVVRGGMPERKVVVNKGLYDQVAAQLEPAAAR